MDLMGLMPLLGGVGGLFGGEQEPEMPDEIKKIVEMLMKRYRVQMKAARSIPGSQPGELAAMSQMQALSGQQAAGQREGLFSQMGPGDANGYGDALKGLGAMQSAQSSGINQQMMLEFMRNRQQMRQGATGLLGQAGNLASGSYRQPPSNGFEGLAPALGQLAYFSAMRRGQSGGTGGYSGSDDNSYGTSYIRPEANYPPPWQQR